MDLLPSQNIYKYYMLPGGKSYFLLAVKQHWVYSFSASQHLKAPNFFYLVWEQTPFSSQNLSQQSQQPQVDEFRRQLWVSVQPLLKQGHPQHTANDHIQATPPRRRIHSLSRPTVPVTCTAQKSFLMLKKDLVFQSVPNASRPSLGRHFHQQECKDAMETIGIIKVI